MTSPNQVRSSIQNNIYIYIIFFFCNSVNKDYQSSHFTGKYTFPRLLHSSTLTTVFSVWEQRRSPSTSDLNWFLISQINHCSATWSVSLLPFTTYWLWWRNYWVKFGSRLDCNKSYWPWKKESVNLFLFPFLCSN